MNWRCHEQACCTREYSHARAGAGARRRSFDQPVDPVAGVVSASDGDDIDAQGPLPLGAGGRHWLRRDTAIRKSFDRVADRDSFFCRNRSRRRSRPLASCGVGRRDLAYLGCLLAGGGNIFPQVFGGGWLTGLLEGVLLALYLW